MSDLDLFGDVSRADTGERDALDFYETPAWMTRSLLRIYGGVLKDRVVAEPCSGRNAIVDVLRPHCRLVLTNDIDRRHPAQRFLDATTPECWDALGQVDYVVTNPTFSSAFGILTLAHQRARYGVVMLLRKTFLEPTLERGPWLEAHPPTGIIGQPRHQFRGNGSDSVSCDWMVWDKTGVPPFIYIDHMAASR